MSLGVPQKAGSFWRTGGCSCYCCIVLLNVDNNVTFVVIRPCSVCTLGSENTAACILRFDCRWSYVVSFTPQMFTLGEKVLYLEARRLAGHGLVWMWQWREEFVPVLGIEQSLCSQ